MSALEKVRCGRLHADWCVYSNNSEIIRIQWIFCPGHAGVQGNERADKLAGSVHVEDRIRENLTSRRRDECNTLDAPIEKEGVGVWKW